MPYTPTSKRKHWQPTKEQKAKQSGFTRDVDKRYYSTRWRKFSAAYRKRHPICATPGCGRLTEVTDHINPVRLGGDFWAGPFQPLCHRCHNSKTAKESNIKPKEAR